MDLLHKILGGLGATMAAAAILGLFAMWSSLNRMEAERPLRDQLRALEMVQIQQGIQLNQQQNDVQNMEIADLERRIAALEGFH